MTPGASLDRARQLLARGELEQAEAAVQAALARTKSGGGRDASEAADVLTHIVFSRLGQDPRDDRTLALAERLLKLRWRHRGSKEPLAGAFDTRGVVHALRGEIDLALADFWTAVEILEAILPAGDPGLTSVYNHLANALQDSAEFGEARQYYLRSLSIMEAHEAVSPEYSRGIAREKAKLLHNFGQMLHILADNGESLAYLKRALAIRSRLADREEHVTLDALAGVYRSIRRYATARRYSKKSLLLVKDDLHKAFLENNLGLIELEAGRHARAKTLFQRAVTRIEKSGDRSMAGAAGAHMVHNLGVALAALGDLRHARRRLEHALRLRSEVLPPLHPEQAESRRDLARTIALQGDSRTALELSLEAGRRSREHLRATIRVLAERVALDYTSKCNLDFDLTFSIASSGGSFWSVEKAYDTLVQSRASVLDEMASRTRVEFHPSVAALAEKHLRASTRFAKITLARSTASNRALVQAARREKEAAETALAKASAEFRKSMTRRRMTAPDVIAKLPDGVSMVSFARYNRYDFPRKRGDRATTRRLSCKPVAHYVAFVLGPDSSRRRTIAISLGPASRIDTLVKHWRAAAGEEISPARPVALRQEHAYRRTGRRLRRAIWDPVLSGLRSGRATRTVLVVPDGSLNLVNIPALPDDDSGYLVEAGPVIHFLSAERDVARFGRRGSKGKGLLMVGAPDFDASGASGPGNGAVSKTVPADGQSVSRSARLRSDIGDQTWLPLPGSRLEATAISVEWRRAHTGRSERPLVLIGLRASEGSVKKHAPGRLVIHFATHAYFLAGKSRGILSEAPLLRTGLVLAGANNLALCMDESGDEDGLFSAEEIAAMNLSGVEWAVLSGCETGLGTLRTGEGILGLRRAFEIAGAESLIMSLWRIHDDAVKTWMVELYRSRLAGASTADAVRQASLYTLQRRRSDGQDTHPFWWGAFLAAGNWA